MWLFNGMICHFNTRMVNLKRGNKIFLIFITGVMCSCFGLKRLDLGVSEHLLINWGKKLIIIKITIIIIINKIKLQTYQ